MKEYYENHEVYQIFLNFTTNTKFAAKEEKPHWAASEKHENNNICFLVELLR